MTVITISRQYSSRGDEIAAQLCQRLGYRAFDKVLLAQMAAEAKLATDEVVDFSEDDYKVRSFLERLFILDNPRVIGQAGSWQETESGSEREAIKALDEEAAVGLVQDTVRAAHKRDNIVIVGRGGQDILKDEKNVLHIRIVAPLAIRGWFFQVQNNIAPETALGIVEERDRASAEYLKRFYNLDWDDPALYHLTINTGKWEVAGAVEIIEHALNLMDQTG